MKSESKFYEKFIQNGNNNGVISRWHIHTRRIIIVANNEWLFNYIIIVLPPRSYLERYYSSERRKTEVVHCGLCRWFRGKRICACAQRLGRRWVWGVCRPAICWVILELLWLSGFKKYNNTKNRAYTRQTVKLGFLVKCITSHPKPVCEEMLDIEQHH